VNADKYIASIKRLFVAITALSVLVAYLGIEEWRKDFESYVSFQLQSILSVLDSTAQLNPGHPISGVQVGVMFLEAMSISAQIGLRPLLTDEQIKGLERQSDEVAARHKLDRAERERYKQKIASGDGAPFSFFKQDVVDSAYLLSNFASRYAPSSDCIAIAVQGPKSASMSFPFYNIQMLKLDQSKLLSDIYLVNFSLGCSFANFNLDSAILLKEGDWEGGWLIGIPKRAFGPPAWEGTNGVAQGYVLNFKDARAKMLEALPEQLREYFKSDDEYLIFRRNTLERLVLGQARRVTGRARSASDLPQALDDITETAEDRASVGGVSARGSLIIAFAPLAILYFLYIMRLRFLRIVKYKLEGDEPWIPRDASTKIDVLIAFTWSTLPLFAVLVVNVTYAFSFYQMLQIGTWQFGIITLIHAPITFLTHPREILFPYYSELLSVLFLVEMWLASSIARDAIRIIRAGRIPRWSPRYRHRRGRGSNDKPI
jgi:hypothetical protein